MPFVQEQYDRLNEIVAGATRQDGQNLFFQPAGSSGTFTSQGTEFVGIEILTQGLNHRDWSAAMELFGTIVAEGYYLYFVQGGLTPMYTDDDRVTRSHVPYHFVVSTQPNQTMTVNWNVTPLVPEEVVCPEGHSVWTHPWVCFTCDTELGCHSCRCTPTFQTTRVFATDTRGIVACDRCISTCRHRGCEDFTLDRYHPRCTQHATEEFGYYVCQVCQTHSSYENEFTGEPNARFCLHCWDVRPHCHTCNAEGEPTLFREVPHLSYEDEPYWACEPCYVKATEGFGEVLVWEGDIEAEALTVPSLPDRPTRPLSIEQEMILSYDKARNIARTLYPELMPYQTVEGYHSSGHTNFCHFETDSSIAGVELIYNRLDLSSEDTEKMATVMSLVRNEEAEFDATTSTHFHQDLHGLSLDDVKNLVIVYSYLEDVIYRIAGTGYEKHRTLIRTGRNYAQTLKKEEYKDAKEFGMKFLRTAQHTDSLNLQHYYRALQNCECGAAEFGTGLATCECNLGKLTAEWRVFNGTNHPRKIKTWAALVQAITSWARGRELTYSEFTPLSFGTVADESDITERVRWMLTTLPLLEDEQENLVWALANTESPFPLPIAQYHDMIRSYEPERELDGPPDFVWRGSVQPARVARPIPNINWEPQWVEYQQEYPNDPDL
jgi:hypothetical protein